MKYPVSLLIVFTIAIVTFASFIAPRKQNMRASGEKGFALVELFTSEGCSSCPPADALLARITKDYAGKVYALSFHVDYWNRLGWKDVYSNPLFTKRQEAYSDRFGLNSVYTPQAIVNGKAELTGSDEKALRSAIEKELDNKPKDKIDISAKAENSHVAVTYKTEIDANRILNIALVQVTATSNIKAGENEGRVLNHTNVVRALKIIKSSSQVTGNIMLEMPEKFSPGKYKIIAWLQDGETGVVQNVSDCTIAE